MAEGLKIVVDAEVQKAEKAFAKFAKSVQKDAASTAAGVQTSFAKIPPVVNKTATSFNAAVPAVQKTKFSMLELNRVIQDAPFGLIGIQNNLTQLIPNIGIFSLAISGVISALTFAQVGFSAWSRGASSSGKQALASATDIVTFRKEIENLRETATADATGEIGKIQALANAVLDQTKSYKERNNALNQLKDINKSYFGDLDLESSKLALLQSRVDEYTKAIINQAVIKAFSDQIGKVAIEISNQEKAVKKAAVAVDSYKDRLNKAASDVSAPRGIAATSSSFQDVENASIKATSTYNSQLKTLVQLKTQYAELQGEIQKATDESLKLRPLEVDESGVNSFDKLVRETIARANKLAKFFSDTTPFELKFELDPELPKADQLKKAQEFIRNTLANTRTFSKLEFGTEVIVDPELDKDFLKRFDEKMQAQIKKSEGITLDIQAIRIPEVPKDVFGRLNDQIAKAASKEARIKPIPIPIELVIEAQRLQNAINNINKIVETTAIEGLSSLGDTIGQALVGGDIGKGLQAFVNIIGSAVQSIGKELISLGVTALLAKKALGSVFSNPGVAIAAGVALVAVGAAMKKSLSKGITGFAEGGLAFGPTLGLVGEGPGTRRGNPEVIAPLDKLQKLIGLGGNTNPVVMDMALRGNVILLSQKRTERLNKIA